MVILSARKEASMLPKSLRCTLVTSEWQTVHIRRHVDPVSRYTAQVQLSTKVVDTLDKLQRTLLHELCHVVRCILPTGAAC